MENYEIFRDKNANKSIMVVSLNEGITIQELLDMSNLVYVQIPDIPLKQGRLMVNIGHTLTTLGDRLDMHLFDNFGLGGNSTDLAISRDTDRVMYLKVVKTGVMDRESALRAESLITAQYAYDNSTLPNKEYCDVMRLLKYDKETLSKLMYNKQIVQNYKGNRIITGRDYDDIVNGEYSILDQLELDLFRIGATYQKVI